MLYNHFFPGFSIWEHLEELVQVEETTVIITTHYIEEAKGCDTLGILRHGKLLAEENPQVLMNKYSSPTLEQVVVQLCHRNKRPLHLPNNDGVPGATTETFRSRRGSTITILSECAGQESPGSGIIIKALIRNKLMRQRRNVPYV